MSKAEFHAMFKRTYGMIYEQHSYVFAKLFEELERYYNEGDVEFDAMMDKFFGILYQKMFTVLNSQYSFDEKYLSCVNEHMREIKPFEDVPQKLSVQLRRAFVATRTFHKALQAGADVVRNMMQVKLTSECVTAWSRMRFCGSCAGDDTPACSRYCHNVLRGCLPAHADLGDHWDAYVEAIDKVADRLLGPFNIAMVVEPIDIKISEAIMSFQEHNQEISQKIFAGCGKPVLGGGGGGAGPFFAPDRSKRAVRQSDYSLNRDNDIDDFEIETSFESVRDDPRFAFRVPEIKRATQELAEQAKLRERFLQYMRGNMDLKEYEQYEHERRRRDAEPEPAAASSEIDYRAFDFDGKRGSKKKKPSAKSDDVNGAGASGGSGGNSEWGGAALERLVREARARLHTWRRYWAQLPALLCAPVSVTSAPCFNGTAVASYTLSAAGSGAAGLASNPEVRGGALGAGAGASARALQDRLRALTASLRDAYNGVETAWRDTNTSPQMSQSRQDLVDSGSGSGSGDRADDDESDDDEDYGEIGSGHIPEFEEPTETEREPETAPPQPETPFVPNVIDGPGTNNVNVRGRIADDIIPVDTADSTADISPQSADKPQESAPVDRTLTGSAQRPSLQKALFTYALPVVCAWFGTIVTDLF
ncbi:unnamed protein product [Chilo suppressalis]|uniref:Glypican-6 n=1 Tax=Chilo suppressalis TaxID=168631 RepID=A0ABN8BBU8_CHISP|nr:unnamed protein product [Chilo suppressalis]